LNYGISTCGPFRNVNAGFGKMKRFKEITKTQYKKRENKKVSGVLKLGISKCVSKHDGMGTSKLNKVESVRCSKLTNSPQRAQGLVLVTCEFYLL
jgi:hypothetical protein